MFVGRMAELNKLNEMYTSGKFECAIIYGRRRVGKTTLIKEFIKNKRAIYFLAREADGSQNLTGFSNDVYAITAPELARNAFFTDWERAFDYIYQISKNERLILAIDEYPYLAGGYGPVSSIIQAHIDTRLKDSKLFLIICGSSMGFMEKQVLAYKSPLYGRRTAQFKVLPFSFFESSPFFDGAVNFDKALYYGMTGGIPEYLAKIDMRKSFRDNAISLFFTPQGYMFEEPMNLLREELREPSTYNGIIEAVATGATRLNDIASKCGMESNKCVKYLSSLIMLGIIKKEIPVTETASKKSMYLVDDIMFRFWYRFVFHNLSGIVSGLGAAIFDNEVSGQISSYMGFIFEDICKQYLISAAKKGGLPFFTARIGKWWGNNPKLRRQEEIDALAVGINSRIDEVSAIGGAILLCECKWTNSPVDIDVLDDLTEQGSLFPQYEEQWYWLFSKSGFTEKLHAAAAERSECVKLISYDDMVLGP